MASLQTPNLQLVEYGDKTDSILRSDYNGNMTKIDNFAGQTKDDIETLEEGLAYIVGNTNTTGGTLAVGQFVYVKGHSTIPNGLRKVTASISNNGSITTSNTSPDTAGGLNTLNSKITDIDTISEIGLGVSGLNLYKVGKIRVLRISGYHVDISSTQIANVIPSGHRPNALSRNIITNGNASIIGIIGIFANGALDFTISSSGDFYGEVVYLVN